MILAMGGGISATSRWRAAATAWRCSRGRSRTSTPRSPNSKPSSPYSRPAQPKNNNRINEMPSYTPPVRDTRFVLEHVVGLDRYLTRPGFEAATPEVVDAVLEEGGRFVA